MSDVPPAEGPIPILFQDAEIVVVHKPAGCESAGRDAQDERSLQFRLAAMLQRPVWAVHQLDRFTSGVQVFALRRAGVAHWQKLFSTPALRKYYWALVEGEPAFAGWQRLAFPLTENQALRRVEVAASTGPLARPALTWVRALALGRGHAWVEARLGTGRTHQVRVHLAHIGHPIVGDVRYGAGGSASDPATELAPGRFALHAARLEVTLPDARHAFRAPLPPDLVHLSQRLGLPPPELPALPAHSAPPKGRPGSPR